MARIQILELPEGAGDERPPFALIIDEYQAQRYILGPDQAEPISELDGVAEKIGARCVLVFEETVEIPANEITLGPDGQPLRLHVEGDFSKRHEQAEEAAREMQERFRLGAS